MGRGCADVTAEKERRWGVAREGGRVTGCAPASRAERRLADSWRRSAPTGLKRRGAETRKNSVSRVTAPTVPAARARTIPRVRAGGAGEGGGDAPSRSRAAGPGPDSTKRAARPLAPGLRQPRSGRRPRRVLRAAPAAPKCPRTAGEEEPRRARPVARIGLLVPPPGRPSAGGPGLGGLKSGRETKAAASLLRARSPSARPGP